MQTKTRPELYRSFIDYVRVEIRRERSTVSRQMFNVFLWCFLFPAIVAITLLLLVKFHVLPRSVRAYLDWVVLVFPVSYSLYFLSSQVLAEIPAAFKSGGMALTLEKSCQENAWRERVCEGLNRTVEASADQWKWIIANFKMDLEAMQYRTKYLTALAGAVFFLIMQGIDSIVDDGQKVTWIRDSVLGWVEASSNLSQFVGLGLFLVLLYLSGSQTCQSLVRYLNCAELLMMNKEKQENK